jgi:hypothetical protein
LPRGRGGDHGFEIDLVRVQQQANEGHLVVGLIAHVGDDDGARMACEVVDVGGWNLGAERGRERGGQQESEHGAESLGLW